MPQPNDEDEAIEILYHGTTLNIALQILAVRKFDLQATFFSSVRELAVYFSHRSRERQKRPSNPAVLRIPVYRSDLLDWRRGRLVASKGFDEMDKLELRGKTQLIFSPEAVRLLNTYSFADEWAVEPVESARTNPRQ
jgi:hypothetical protein